VDGVVFSKCGAVTAVSLTHGDIQPLKSRQPGNLSEATMVRISNSPDNPILHFLFISLPFMFTVP